MPCHFSTYFCSAQVRVCRMNLLEGVFRKTHQGIHLGERWRHIANGNFDLRYVEGVLIDLLLHAGHGFFNN